MLKTFFVFLSSLVFALAIGFSPAHANVPGGGTGTGANVTVTDNGGTVVLANGIVLLDDQQDQRQHQQLHL